MHTSAASRAPLAAGLPRYTLYAERQSALTAGGLRAAALPRYARLICVRALIVRPNFTHSYPKAWSVIAPPLRYIDYADVVPSNATGMLPGLLHTNKETKI